MSILVIAEAKIRMDSEGRYSLNDLHKSAGNERRHGPSLWLENQQTKELVAEMETTGIPVVKKEGRSGGTFVAKQLVYAYAMWISPKFHLQVIDAYDALVDGRLLDAQRIASRQAARLEAPYMTDAVKHAREVKGKPVAHYHFSNEFDLINRVALGATAKEYRSSHGIAPESAIRDHLTRLEIRCIEHLQRANATMIDLGFDFDKRKTELNRLYVCRHSAGLMSEIQRLES